MARPKKTKMLMTTLPFEIIEALEKVREKTMIGKSTLIAQILGIALKPEIDLILEERKKNKKK